MILSYDQITLSKLSLEKAASATMTPKTETDKKAVEIEKNMMVRLKQLGLHRSLVGCASVSSYEQKETGSPKFGIVMSFCNGGDLKEVLDHSQDYEMTFGTSELSDDELELIADDLLNGLNFLREHGIYHSDLKPGNILLQKNRFGEIVGAKIADFGCARDLNDPTQRFYFSGDRGYHSPELKKIDLKMAERIDPELRPERELLENCQLIYKQAVEAYHLANSLLEEKQSSYDQAVKSGISEDELGAQQKEIVDVKQAVDDASQKIRDACKDFESARFKFIEKRELLVSQYREEMYQIDDSIFKSDVYAMGMVFEFLFLGRTPNQFSEMETELKSKEDALAAANAELEKAIAENAGTKKIGKIEEKIKMIQDKIDKIRANRKKMEEVLEKKEKRISPQMKELIHAMMETDLSKRLSADEAMSRFKSLQEEGLIFQTRSETPAIHRGPEELVSS